VTGFRQQKNIEVKGFETHTIGIVVAQFNKEITDKLEFGAKEALLKAGLSTSQIKIHRVPGAFEIPLVAQKLFDNGVDGVVALGCVIRGETTHYESVCAGAEQGCMDVQLKYGRPIGFGILMTENLAQAQARAGGDFGNKGAEASEVVLEILETIKSINVTTKGEIECQMNQ